MPDQGRPITPQYMAPGARASTYSHAYSMAEPRGQGQGYYPSPSQQPLRSPGTPQQMYLGSPATPTMFDVADETLASEIRFILSTNDLGNITKKQVRAKLQESFQMDLSHKKDFINATIDSILNQQQ
ncbi:hypothetical protein CONCODRAFT_17686 [Conidiobolus coronatus NRRL 28638]|uniref:DEK-C domain-containing protein n=1 Tax=Conidiobolus coronatus (strain ATCC 28846 / CBS 209.66 / NRRL 28638) TaxID=796925 RepID=A0A137P5V4_CONC2|nr:hypothetical protein CONCODRAFT_17686 [Conidiobolus coronatus NRRL 28638]|eukprot:KXN70387.1 hypothetical protein CONCODRAFT_17686 [Conidiobolus coronatus NRRL 28638]